MRVTTQFERKVYRYVERFGLNPLDVVEHKIDSMFVDPMSEEICITTTDGRYLENVRVRISDNTWWCGGYEISENKISKWVYSNSIDETLVEYYDKHR